MLGAHVDMYERVIYNADPDTVAWYHEERHLWQFDTFLWLNGFHSFLHQLGLFAMFGVAFSSLIFRGSMPDPWVVFFMLPGFLILLLLELDAHIYSVWKWFKKH